MKFLYFKFMSIVILSLSPLAYSTDLDQTYVPAYYHKLGIPKSIKSLEDYETIGEVFYSRAITANRSKKKDTFPKYDSEKSKSIFSLIIDYNLIDELILTIEKYEEKQNFLLTLRNIMSKLFSAYSIQSSSHNYDDELARINNLQLYAVIRSSEIYDGYLKNNQLVPEDITTDNFALYIGKIAPHYELCGSVILLSSFKLDEPTKKFIDHQLVSFKNRIDKLSYVKKGLSISKESCFKLELEVREETAKRNKPKE